MKLFLLLLFGGFSLGVIAQEPQLSPPETIQQVSTDTAKLRVDKILITGSRKTKSYII